MLLLIGLVLDLVAPLLLKELIDQTLSDGNLGRLNLLIGLFVVVYGVKFVADLAGGACRNRFNESCFLAIRQRLFDHIQGLSLRFFHTYQSGYLTSRIFSDTNQLGGLLGNMWLSGLSNLVMVCGAIGIVLYLNWRLTLVLLLVVPLLAFVTRLFNSRIQAASHAMQEQVSQLCSGVQENLSGMSLIQSYKLERFSSGRINRELQRLRTVNLRLADLNLFHSTGTLLLTSIAGLSILWFGSRELVQGNLTMGELMAFLAYAVNVYRPVQALLALNLSIQTSTAAASRIFEILDTAPEVEDLPGAPDLPTPVRGAVRYVGVSFAYDEQDVLEEIDFTIEPGMKVAIVGRSGAGKTTLLSLLSRFYDPRQGRIEIDGHDIRTVALHSLRQAIGIVSQDTFLFAGSIRENLQCIAPEASEQDLLRVMEAAQLGELLKGLEHGLDTELGERGMRVSGGERQRLSIARALLKDPPILILDEATSSVDSISENRIQAAIEQLLASGRTCFVIAHRLSTVVDADRILVMDRGRLVGQGTHDELYAGNSCYQKLYDEQLSGRADLAAGDQTVRIGKEEEYLLREDNKNRRVIVRTLDSGVTRVEVTPLARVE